MAKIAVLGHLVKDYWIGVSSLSRYKDKFSVDEVLDLAKSQGDEIKSAFGGTALTWTQYLIPTHNVSPISVLGNDLDSKELKALFTSNEQINLSGIKTYNGSIPRFVLVFPKKPEFDRKNNPHWKQIIYWEGRIAETRFKDVVLSPQFLGEHYALVLPITEPSIALKAAKSYLLQNPSGKIVYNPGRYLHGFGLSFERTCFEELVVNYATTVLLNGEEVGAVQSSMHLGNISRLFRIGRRLELIIHTKGLKGSVVYSRKDNKKYEPSEVHGLFVDPSFELGAGDAYGATFHRKIFNGSSDSLDEALNCATRTAEHCLTFEGALCTRRMQEKNFIDPNVKVHLFRI